MAIQNLEVYEKIAKSRIIPTPDTYQTIEVICDSSSDMLKNFASIDFIALKDKVEVTGGSLPEDFTVERYAAYLSTLIYSRIQWVVGGRFIIHPNDDIAVPAFPSNVIMNIGRAEDISRGITLVPKSKIVVDINSISEDQASNSVLSRWDLAVKKAKLLTREECRRISMIIKSIPGAVYAKGYLKDKSGTFSFMSMQLVDSHIKTYTAETHPVYALLASIIEPTLVCDALSPTVRYGDVTYLKGLYWELTTV